jgi:hypothetical protein
VYRMCEYYVRMGLITRQEARAVLVAAIFHDFDHTGQSVWDMINIARAIEGLRRHILPEDEMFGLVIESLIEATEFPHKAKSEHLSLLYRMLRDADMVQALGPVWIQDIVFGLAKERDVPPFEVLRQQEGFLQKLEFHTEWAQKHYPRSMIEDKIAEAPDLIEILQTSPEPVPA